MEDNEIEIEKQLLKEYGELCIRYMDLCRLIAECELGFHKEEIGEEEFDILEEQRRGMKIYRDALDNRLREYYLINEPYQEYLLEYGEEAKKCLT